MVGAQFWRVGPSRNRSGERLRTAPAKKTTKIASGAVSGGIFSTPVPFFVDFGLPAGTQNGAKTGPEASTKLILDVIFFFFGVLSAQVRSGRVSDRFRSPPGSDFQEFYDTFLLVFAILFCRLRADFVRVCRVPPGCCRDPHPASVIHSPFSPGVR